MVSNRAMPVQVSEDILSNTTTSLKNGIGRGAPSIAWSSQSASDGSASSKNNAENTAPARDRKHHKQPSRVPLVSDFVEIVGKPCRWDLHMSRRNHVVTFVNS